VFASPTSQVDFTPQGALEKALRSGAEAGSSSVLNEKVSFTVFCLQLPTPEQERRFYLDHLAKGMEGPLNYARTYKARYDEERGMMARVAFDSQTELLFVDLPSNLNPNLPVLFIWGTLDRTTTSFLIKKSHKFIPRLQDVALEGKGHWIMVEAKDEVTEIIASWLQRLTISFPIIGKL
jgi:soluble epoxide hydrolase/lipid-phosphate phosphatase